MDLGWIGWPVHQGLNRCIGSVTLCMCVCVSLCVSVFVCVCVCVSVLSWVFDEKSLHDINISLFFKMAPFPRAAQC